MSDKEYEELKDKYRSWPHCSTHFFPEKEFFAQLEADKKRLDWLENNISRNQWHSIGMGYMNVNLRNTIDAAMKGDSIK